jgi:hypothetical protein
MTVADDFDFPVSVHAVDDSQPELPLVEKTLTISFVKNKPERLTGDRAYDSGPLDTRVEVEGIQAATPHLSITRS